MTKPFEPKATLDEMSRYLTEVDGYLLSLLKDQETRLDHIEEMAQALLSSGADPVEEFGPAETYASELADAVGRTSMPSWMRVVLTATGSWLLAFGLFTTIDHLAGTLTSPDGYPQELLLDPTLALSGLFASLASIDLVSPKARSFQARVFRTGSKMTLLPTVVYLLIVFALFMFPSVRLPDAVFGRFVLPEQLNAPAFAGFLALVGLGLIFASGFPKLIIAGYRNRRRPNSVFRYRLLEDTARVQLLRPAH